MLSAVFGFIQVLHVKKQTLLTAESNSIKAGELNVAF
jgi:hypothetical protein